MANIQGQPPNPCYLIKLRPGRAVTRRLRFMAASAPRGRLSIAMMMVLVAYIATFSAGCATMIRDWTRPDYLTALYCFFGGLNTLGGFCRNQGRDLAGAWGYSSGALSVFVAGQIWLDLVYSPTPPATGILRLMIWNFWPVVLAPVLGLFRQKLALWRYDHLQQTSREGPATFQGKVSFRKVDGPSCLPLTARSQSPPPLSD